jgi:Response regulator receiver domain
MIASVSFHTNKGGSILFFITMGKAWFGGELLMPRKILIVEDSCDLREMLRTILTAYGWNPILAESGRKALEKLEHETPAIILMDMSMPDMSGFELATILKKIVSTRASPSLQRPRFRTISPGIGVLRRAAMVSFPNLSRLPRSNRVLQI